MRKDHALILIPLCILQFFSGLGGIDIYWHEEAQNAGCAKEMLHNNELVVPTFNCELRPQKPPLHYYFMMAGYRIFGEGPLGARFFSGLMGFLTVMLIYISTARIADPNAGLFAAASLGLALHFPLVMKQAIPDPYLIFFTTAAVLGIFAGRKLHRPMIAYGGYISLGLAILAKGPIAAVITALAFFILFVINGKGSWKEISAYRPLSGTVLTVAVSVPWYILVDRATQGAYTEGFFVTHNFGRFANTLDGNGGIFLISWAFILLGLFPATVYLFQSLQYGWQARKRSDAAALAFSAFAAVAIIFTFSNIRIPNYTAPAYPFAAILIGLWMSHTLKKSIAVRRRFLIPSLIIFLLSVGIMLGAYFGLRNYPDTEHMANYAFYLAPGVLFGALSIVAAFKRREERSLIYQGSFALWTSLVVVYILLPRIDTVNPLRALESDNIQFENLAAYEHINPAWVYKYGCIDYYDRNSIEELRRKLSTGQYQGVITRELYYQDLSEIGTFENDWQYRDLFEHGVTTIYRPVSRR